MELPDDLPLISFPDADAFGRWLEAHHASSPGVWLEIPKKKSGVAGPTYAQALEEALRFGWIDSQKRRRDDDVFVQRFTPRAARSPWSKINRGKVEALLAAGRMAPAGLAEVDKAKADGRWEAAYDSPSTATVPPDLQSAREAEPEALRFFEGLSASQRHPILYRIQEAKRSATRERRIAKYVAMCARGERVR